MFLSHDSTDLSHDLHGSIWPFESHDSTDFITWFAWKHLTVGSKTHDGSKQHWLNPNRKIKWTNQNCVIKSCDKFVTRFSKTMWQSHVTKISVMFFSHDFNGCRTINARLGMFQNVRSHSRLLRQREFEGQTCFVNPVCRLHDFQHKKCNSGGLALCVFILSHLTNTFCTCWLVLVSSPPAWTRFHSQQNVPKHPSTSVRAAFQQNFEFSCILPFSFVVNSREVEQHPPRENQLRMCIKTDFDKQQNDSDGQLTHDSILPSVGWCLLKKQAWLHQRCCVQDSWFSDSMASMFCSIWPDCQALAFSLWLRAAGAWMCTWWLPDQLCLIDRFFTDANDDLHNPILEFSAVIVHFSSGLFSRRGKLCNQTFKNVECFWQWHDFTRDSNHEWKSCPEF